MEIDSSLNIKDFSAKKSKEMFFSKFITLSICNSKVLSEFKNIIGFIFSISDSYSFVGYLAKFKLKTSSFKSFRSLNYEKLFYS